jgi:hypothetical protein
MEVRGQIHAPAALAPRNNSGTQWIEGCVGPRTKLLVLEKRKNRLSGAGIWTQDRSAHSLARK